MSTVQSAPLTPSRLLDAVAAPVDELAALILAQFFGGEASDSVSRQNAVNSMCQVLGVVGQKRRDTSRALAEGWQLLERRGLICRDVEQGQGDWWFLTRAGAGALRSPALASHPQND